MMTLTAILCALALQDTFKHENTESNLKQLFERLERALAAGDEATALALTNSLVPDEAGIRKGLREGIPPETIAKIGEFVSKSIPNDASKRARVFAAPAGATEVRVLASTTEQLQKYEKGSVAFEQFPAGARRVAENLLRPKSTYYEVVLAKPGEPSGLKLHLFYWAEGRWSMLGPLWRTLQ